MHWIACAALFASPVAAASAQSPSAIRYLGAVDHRLPGQPGSLIAVTHSGGVIELPHAVGSDCIVRPMPDGGFLVLDRQNQRLLRLGRRGMLRTSITLPAGSQPRDALPVGPQSVWITRSFTNTIEVVDLATGAASPGPDLGPLLMGETIADPEMMLAHGGRVYVQLQRLDDALPFVTVGPGALAVFDQNSHQPIDADASAPGPQPIALTGPSPHLRMHLINSGTHLLVGATGPRLDPNQINGGIERIDLAQLTSEGFIEEELAGNIGAFAPTGTGIGALSFHTSIIEASHVTSFDTQPGNLPTDLIFEELFVTIETMAYDPHTGTVLMPGADGGMNEFDPITRTRSRTQLFETTTGSFIRDLALAHNRRITEPLTHERAIGNATATPR